MFLFFLHNHRLVHNYCLSTFNYSKQMSLQILYLAITQCHDGSIDHKITQERLLFGLENYIYMVYIIYYGINYKFTSRELMPDP